MQDFDYECDHPYAGRVSYPIDLTPPVEGPVASTYICETPACINEAKQWVKAITGHDGEYVEMPALRKRYMK